MERWSFLERERAIERVKKWFGSSKVVVAMLMVQIFTTSLQLLMRVILYEGTFVFKYVAYRNIVAAFCVAPLVFCFERGVTENLMRWSVWFWLFLSALTGVTMTLGLYSYGLRDTTATYTTNFLNLIPITTFFFSTVLGIEKLGINTRAGKLKALGAIICVAGALTASLYEGKAFHIRHFSPHPHFDVKSTSMAPHNWARGTLMLVGSVLSIGAWYIIQVKLIKVFPFKFCTTMLACIIASIQSTLVGLCLDRSKAAWKLERNLELLTILYSGTLNTAASFCLTTWAIATRGPTYPAMFGPLSLVFVALLEAIIFGEVIKLGILLGMIMMIVGLYSFLWGKNKEVKHNLRDQNPSDSVRSEALNRI